MTGGPVGLTASKTWPELSPCNRKPKFSVYRMRWHVLFLNEGKIADAPRVLLHEPVKNRCVFSAQNLVLDWYGRCIVGGWTSWRRSGGGGNGRTD